MDWITTKATRDKEDKLLNTWWLARDTGDIYGDCHARLDILDYYTGEGCPSPDVALLAALLINPATLSEVRDIVTAAMLPRYHDAALYQAMLCTPLTGGLAEWWQMLAKVAGLTIGQVTLYLQYDYANCANVSAYAEVICNTYRHTCALQIAERMLGDLYDAGAGLDKAITDLERLRTETGTISTGGTWAGNWKARQ